MTDASVLTPAGEPPRRGLVVLCAANNYDGIKLADQHMAEQLAKLRPVLYVDPPLSLLSARNSAVAAKSLEGERLRLISAGLMRLTPVVLPFPSRPWMISFTERQVRYLLRRAVAHLGVEVDAVISAWPMYQVLGSCREKVKVYWAQDDFVGGAGLLGLNPGMLDRKERRNAAEADVVVASNPQVAETWKGRGYKPALIPFGVDTMAYAAIGNAPRPSDVKLLPPIAGFIGHINARIDLDLLNAVANSGVSLLLVGPMSPGDQKPGWDKLLAKPNVQWVGPRAFAELPGYMQLIDVGLVPYADNAFNRGSFPLKTLEYLAAGRPVVSTGLPASRWLNTDLITIADTAADFAAAVLALARQPRSTDQMAARRAFASGHDYAGRARAMLATIDQTADDMAFARS